MTPSYQSRPKTLSDLFQGTLSLEPSIKLKERLRPSPLLQLTVCFSRQVNVVPPQAAAAKVTVLYVAVHLTLRSVVTAMTPEKTLTKANTAKTVTTTTNVTTVTTVKSEPPVATATTVTTMPTVKTATTKTMVTTATTVTTAPTVTTATTMTTGTQQKQRQR